MSPIYPKLAKDFWVDPSHISETLDAAYDGDLWYVFDQILKLAKEHNVYIANGGDNAAMTERTKESQTNRLYFDGGCSPNPGQMRVCIILNGVASMSKLNHGTNNLAEWTALLWGLSVAIDQRITELDVYGDSQLIVNQANGSWRCKNVDLQPFKSEYDRLRRRFTTLTLRWVPRATNLAGIHIEQNS